MRSFALACCVVWSGAALAHSGHDHVVEPALFHLGEAVAFLGLSAVLGFVAVRRWRREAQVESSKS